MLFGILYAVDQKCWSRKTSLQHNILHWDLPFKLWKNGKKDSDWTGNVNPDFDCPNPDFNHSQEEEGIKAGSAFDKNIQSQESKYPRSWKFDIVFYCKHLLHSCCGFYWPLQQVRNFNFHNIESLYQKTHDFIYSTEPSRWNEYPNNFYIFYIQFITGLQVGILPAFTILKKNNVKEMLYEIYE